MEDPEAQFYSVIRTNYMSDNIINEQLSHFINYSFHGETTNPPPLSWMWDPIHLKK